MSLHRSSAVLLAGLVAGAVALAGCSSSTSSSTDAPDAGMDRTYTVGTLSTFADYTGATTGAADKGASPIKIGWVNQDTGPGALPDLTAATKSAITLVNTELGGVGGRPVELITCDVNSEESGQSCGQKFANDDDVMAIGQGNLSVGSASFHAAIDRSGIPIVGALPVMPQDGMAPNGFYIGSGSFSTIPAMIALLQGPIPGDKVAIVTVEGEAISSQVGASLAQALMAQGKQVTQAALSMGSTDATSTLVAAGADKADVVIPLVILPPQCVAVDKALTSLKSGAKVLTLGACYSAGVKKTLGDYPKWTYLSGYVNTAAKTDDPAVQAQIDAYQEWADGLDQALDAVPPLQTVLTLQKHLIAGGGADATRADVVAAARAWTGPIFLGPPDVAYGSVTTPFPLPALPGLSTRAYTYDGDGAFTDVTDGEWVG